MNVQNLGKNGTDEKYAVAKNVKPAAFSIYYILLKSLQQFLVL